MKLITVLILLIGGAMLTTSPIDEQLISDSQPVITPLFSDGNYNYQLEDMELIAVPTIFYPFKDRADSMAEEGTDLWLEIATGEEMKLD